MKEKMYLGEKEKCAFEGVLSGINKEGHRATIFEFKNLNEEDIKVALTIPDVVKLIEMAAQSMRWHIDDEEKRQDACKNN